MSTLKKMLALMLALSMLMLVGCTNSTAESATTAPVASEEDTAVTGEALGEPGAAEAPNTLGIIFAATFVSDATLNTLTEKLTTAFPGVTVQAVSTGDSEADPMGTVAGMTRMAGLMASGECDLLITDMANAKRYGYNGESYVAIDTLFTKEEQAELNAAPNPLPITDDEGNETGDETATCMLDFSANTELIALLGIESPQVCVMEGSANIETAKEVIKYLDALGATGTAVG